jgi:hypothetical protein
MIPPPDQIISALERYNAVSRELAGLYPERAKMQNGILEDYDEAYQAAVGEGLAYNPAAARAKSATRRWTMELNKLQGDIDSCLAELRYLDTYIGVHHGSAH